VGNRRLRQRGFAPTLSDSEVITLEVVGEFLGLETDMQIWRYGRRHWRGWFPGLGSRTAFAKQAANLWVLKQRLHQRLITDLGAIADPIQVVDGFPLPVCVITRAPRCRVFAGQVNHGYCAAKREYYYGFHGHLMISFDGVITGLTVTPASGSERDALWDLVEEIQGLLIGDKGYLGTFLKAELTTVGIDLQTPLRANMTDTRDPQAVRRLTQTRRRIETVIGQLTEQFHIEKVRARDLWHLTSRLARKVLAHTFGIFINRSLGRPDLQFAGLIAD
jgi:hypothetical protein